MKIVAEHAELRLYDDYPQGGLEWEAGTRYELLRCPACRNVILRTYFWNDLTMDGSETKFVTLYPCAEEVPLGMPDHIAAALAEARGVRSINPNAYGVLLGRVLELVCEERHARGGNLSKKLADLSSRNEIPQKLVDVADGLKNLRNVGAHPALGELTVLEVPILDKLCVAILEYVYSAPYVAQRAETSFRKLRKSAQAKE